MFFRGFSHLRPPGFRAPTKPQALRGKGGAAQRADTADLSAVKQSGACSDAAKGPPPPMELLARSDILRQAKVICQAFLEKSLIECEEQADLDKFEQ